VFIEAKDHGVGGDNWSYKSCKAPVKSSPPTKQRPLMPVPSHTSSLTRDINNKQNIMVQNSYFKASKKLLNTNLTFCLTCPLYQIRTG